MSRNLHLAVAVYGVGGPGQHGLWKDPRVPKNASVDINYYIKAAQVAEQALFDALFIVDSQFINASYPSHYLNRLEPLTLLSAVATHTTRIGLIATASSTYNSPFNLARRLASLDHISGGRAGWNVVTSFDTGTSKNYGLDEHLDYATRYGRALEAVQVIRSSSRPACRKTAAISPRASPRASTRPAGRPTRRGHTTPVPVNRYTIVREESGATRASSPPAAEGNDT